MRHRRHSRRPIANWRIVAGICTNERIAEPLVAALQRYAVLYLTTLIVLVPVDFLFLGVIGKSFFTTEVGDMLGEVRLAPAILFYLLHVAGILIFVNALGGATWRSTLLYGALFALFCYATFELTSLSPLKHWT